MFLSTTLLILSASAPVIPAAPAPNQPAEKLRCEVINVGTFFADPQFKRVCGTAKDWARYRKAENKKFRSVRQGDQ